MPVLNEFSFSSCDCKNTIYVREWLPDISPIGIVQICHGVNEHITRYDKFAQYLASKGFVVAGNDHLGHGKSISSLDDLSFLGENGGWELVVGDMRKLYERLREQYRNLPIFIFGHSMGSFLTRTYMIRYHDGPDGVIISGTGHQNGFVLATGLFMANSEIKKHGTRYRSPKLKNLAFNGYNSHYMPNRTEFDWLTRDPAVVDAYISDPLCGADTTAGLFRDMFTGIKYITNSKNIERVNKDLPVYLMSGEDDPVGSYGKGVIRTYKDYLKAGLTDVTLKLYHGGHHEMLNEINKEEVYSDISTWLMSKCQRIENSTAADAKD